MIYPVGQQKIITNSAISALPSRDSDRLNLDEEKLADLGRSLSPNSIGKLLGHVSGIGQNHLPMLPMREYHVVVVNELLRDRSSSYLLTFDS